jgi:hypothetical protein
MIYKNIIHTWNSNKNNHQFSIKPTRNLFALMQ